jgi:hypothetical protein
MPTVSSSSDLVYPPGMSAVEPQTRKSRWTRDPIVGHDGTPIAVCPTDRDIEIFKLLARFRYLPADYIHAFVGGNAKALGRRLNLLSRKPNVYLARPPQQRQSAAANHRSLIYDLDERGLRILRERGLSPPPKATHRNFSHELMVAQIIASIELGARDNASIRLITWAEILASEKTPALTRNSAAAGIRVTYSLNSESHTAEITADGQPFGIERMIGGLRTYLFFPGIEADCGTEPISASDSARSSIGRKLAAYGAIAQEGLYRSHFGFPNFFVPFITTNVTRMRSMMELLDRMTGGHGSKMFLFKTFPSFTSAEASPPPDGRMLSEPWQRVGSPPLLLDH